MTDLEKAKSDVNNQIIQGSAPGIVGVGIDPTGSLCDGGSLIVFYSDESKAIPWLKSFLGDSFRCVESRSAEIPPGLARELKPLGRAERVANDPLSLAVGCEICRNKKESGLLGCFVTLADGSVRVLVARHLFDFSQNSGGDVYAYDGSCSGTIIGKNLTPSAIAAKNQSECAVFEPYKVSLHGNPKIVEDFVSSGDIARVGGKKLLSIGSGEYGLVLDVNFPIKYKMPGEGYVLFYNQLLVKNINGVNGPVFGTRGDSGAVVLLGEPVAPYVTGTVVGLYTWADANSVYHVVTPFYGCASAFGIKAVYNQDSQPLAARLRKALLKLRGKFARVFRIDQRGEG